MAALVGGRLIICKNRGQIICKLLSARAASGSSKDVLLGSYPHTEQERAAAAKKYNLRHEDYQPHPDQTDGYGDYPVLPDCSQHERDPWYQWDHPDLRRNWGEPIHYDFDMYIRNRVDTSPSPVDWSTMCKNFFGFFTFMMVMFGLGQMFPAYQPVAPKQLPYNNLYVEHGGDPEQQPEAVKHYEI